MELCISRQSGVPAFLLKFASFGVKELSQEHEIVRGGSVLRCLLISFMAFA